MIRRFLVATKARSRSSDSIAIAPKADSLYGSLFFRNHLSPSCPGDRNPEVAIRFFIMQCRPVAASGGRESTPEIILPYSNIHR